MKEAAERLYPINIVVDYDTNEDIRNIWIEGAKWQQERSYSKEDLEKAFKVGFTLGYVGDTLIADKDKCFNRWFKIFKNK